MKKDLIISVAIKIITIFIALLGMLISVGALMFHLFHLGILAYSFDIFIKKLIIEFSLNKLLTILGAIFSVLYFVINIGILLSKKWALRLNWWVSMPFILLLGHSIITSLPTTFILYCTPNTEEICRSSFWGLFYYIKYQSFFFLIFTIYYIPTMFFLSRPKVKEQFK